MRGRWASYALLAAFLLIAGLGTWGCRAAATEDCERSGGQALVPPLWSRDPTEVRCLRSRR